MSEPLSEIKERRERLCSSSTETKKSMPSEILKDICKKRTFKFYQCPHCDYNTDEEQSVSASGKTAERLTKKILRRTITEHIQTTHDLIANLCNLCTFVASDADSLNYHIKMLHPGKEKYFCSACPRASTNKYYIRKHELIDHNIGEQSPTNTIKGNNELEKAEPKIKQEPKFINLQSSKSCPGNLDSLTKGKHKRKSISNIQRSCLSPNTFSGFDTVGKKRKLLYKSNVASSAHQKVTNKSRIQKKIIETKLWRRNSMDNQDTKPDIHIPPLKQRKSLESNNVERRINPRARRTLSTGRKRTVISTNMAIQEVEQKTDENLKELATQEFEKKPDKDLNELIEFIQKNSLELQEKVQSVINSKNLELYKIPETTNNLSRDVEIKTKELELSRNREVAKDIALSELQKQNGPLRTSLKAKETQFEELLQQQTANQHQVDKLTSDCNVLKAQIKQYTEINIETTREKKETKKEIVALNELVSKQKTAIQEAKKEKENIQRCLLQSQGELEGSLKIQEDLRNELETSKSEHKITRLELDKRQQEVVSLLEENKKIDLNSIGLTKVIEDQTTEIQNYIKENEEIRKQTKDVLESRDDVKYEFTYLTSKYDIMSSSFHDKNKEIKQLRDTVLTLEFENKYLKEMEGSLKTTITEKKEILQEVGKDHDILAQNFKKLQEDLQGSCRQQEELARKLGLKHYHAKCSNIQDKESILVGNSPKENHTLDLQQNLTNSNATHSLQSNKSFNSADIVDSLKEELESLRWYCYGKEKALDTLECLKTELMIQDDIKNKKISELEEVIKEKKIDGSKEKKLIECNQALTMENERLKNQGQKLKDTLSSADFIDHKISIGNQHHQQ